ncbi:MAG: PAS domain S-box protein [Pseudomonadota bacterium]
MIYPASVPPTTDQLIVPDFRRLIDAAPDGVFVADAGGTYVYVNQAGCRMLGMQAHEILGKSIFDLIPEADAMRFRASQHTMLEGRTHVDEFALRHKDGHCVPVEVSANILPDGQWQGFVRDITERKRLERQVQTNERNLSGVFDLLPVGVWIADREGMITHGNEAARKIWSGERRVGPQHYDVYKGWYVDSGEQIAADDWAMARAVSKGETSIGELVRIQCFDGTFKTIIHSAAPVRDDNGEIVGGIVVNEDITELYDAQQQLQESEARFRTVFELIPVGVYVSNREGRITAGNPAGHDIWEGVRHVEPGEYGEYKGWWVDSGKPLAAHDWAITRALRKGETSCNELIRIQCFDGTYKTVMNWAAPIKDQAGNISGAVAMNQDVTALVRTQEQLRMAVQEREQILAVVAHDLRNPLASIAFRAAMLTKKVAENQGAQELVATHAAAIVESAQRMAGLVDDLLAVSVVDSGGTMLKLEPVQADVLLSMAAEQAAPMIDAARLHLALEHDDDMPPVQVDTHRIMRVFGNLLDSALKFTEPAGQIVVRAQAAPGAVRFSIANSGPALPAETVERLFQPFWQAGREDPRGAGLGLSICRAIIEAHGGSVWAESVPGTRLKISFLLPCDRPLPPVS